MSCPKTAMATSMSCALRLAAVSPYGRWKSGLMPAWSSPYVVPGAVAAPVSSNTSATEGFVAAAPGRYRVTVDAYPYQAESLPLLESMAPALARAAAVEAPRRLVTICTTLGLYSSSWFPRTAGAGYNESREPVQEAV